MDYEAYRQAYFVDPPPEPRYDYKGFSGVALFFEEYQKAVAYYTRVLGGPAYVERENTHGWPIGESWLTLFPAVEGSPANNDVTLLAGSPADAERLQKAFIEAGGSGQLPSDELMYEPLRICAVSDPFGTDFLIVARLNE